MDENDLSVVGKSLPRVDSLSKVTGEAKYDCDFRIQGMLHGKILRSPYAHARILNIDTSKAERLPGVKAVITADHTPKIPYGLLIYDEQVLATEKVRYVGDEVAAVAAVDQDAAEEAIELIQVDYEVLPAVFDPEKAIEPGAPQIHMMSPTNIIAELHLERGNVASGFEEAEVVLEQRFVYPNVSQAVMETTGCVANFDSSGRLNIWLSSMDIFSQRKQLAYVLGMSEGKINLIRMTCGGAFGSKCTMKPVYPICALLSGKTGKPVRIFYDREEDLVVGRPRPPSIIDLKAGIKQDGIITARQANVVVDAGAYANNMPYLMMALSTRPDNAYHIKNIKTDSRTVYTNKTPGGAYRGFGGPEMLFALNSMVDMLAEAIGMDPLDVQLKNAVHANTVTAHGYKIKSCGLTECIEKVAEETDWRERRSKKRFKRGMGLACQVHACDMRYWEGFLGSVMFVKILEDGRVLINTGEHDFGQGIETVQTQIVAEVLGIPVGDIHIMEASTDTAPYAIGPYASRLTISGGTAAKLAAEDARDQVFNLASEMMEANPKDLKIREGRIFVEGSTDRFVTLADVARFSQYRLGGSEIIGKGVDERYTDHVYITPPPAADLKMPVECHVNYGSPSSAYFFSAQVVEVEVDTETGKVKVIRLVQADDLGKAINPMMAQGQTEGGTVQGLGFSLTEELKRDAYGRVLNGNLLDYQVPTTMDIPELKVIFVESNEPLGPFGAKGVGEASQNCSGGAMANAIYDAIGVRISSLPITPEKILKAIREKSAMGKGGKQ